MTASIGSTRLVKLAIIVVCLAWSASAWATVVNLPVTGGGTLSADLTLRRVQCGRGYFAERYTSFSYSIDTVTDPGMIAELHNAPDPNCGGSRSYRIPLQSGCEIEFGPTRNPRLVCTGIPGYVGPKYIVVGVSYAPPGPASFVQYVTSASFGNTVSLSDSFTSSTLLEVALSFGVSIGGFFDGKLTITGSSGATQSRTSSSSTTVSIQNLFTTRLGGTPNAFSPVNHDYDIIWLWLNPVMLFTVTPAPPGFPSNVTWNGYGYDIADQPALDIWPIEVGYLNGNFGPLPFQDLTVLARTWASSQTFPPGMGPGLTNADFADILRSHPYSTPGYTVTLDTSTNPLTTTDGRFTISSPVNNHAQAFAYRQPAPGSNPLTQSLSNTYNNASTLSNSTSYQTTTTYGIALSVGAGTTIAKFSQKFETTLRFQKSLSHRYERGTSVTSTTAQINSLSITGPPCGSSTPPCNPEYVGPSQFDVYQDNIFGTFMFHPVR